MPDLLKTDDLKRFEELFIEKVKSIATTDDPAHDLLHFKRVASWAKYLGQREKARMEIVIPSAWLHDLVIVPKDSPLRKEASRLSAEKAIEFLKEIKYPEKYFNSIYHAIHAHSFSAQIQTETIEAKVVQDADRLDGLGAIGIARCFATAALMKRPFYFEEDPFALNRPQDDSLYTIDHFYQKLFKIAESLKTQSGRLEGQKRAQAMQDYLHQLKREINFDFNNEK